LANLHVSRIINHLESYHQWVRRSTNCKTPSITGRSIVADTSICRQVAPPRNQYTMILIKSDFNASKRDNHQFPLWWKCSNQDALKRASLSEQCSSNRPTTCKTYQHFTCHLCTTWTFSDLFVQFDQILWQFKENILLVFDLKFSD
jgi:hypothetical protein